MKKSKNLRTVSDYLSNRDSFTPEELLQTREIIIRCLDKSNVSKNNPFMIKQPKMEKSLHQQYIKALAMIDDDLRWLVQKHNEKL